MLFYFILKILCTPVTQTINIQKNLLLEVIVLECIHLYHVNQSLKIKNKTEHYNIKLPINYSDSFDTHKSKNNKISYLNYKLTSSLQTVLMLSVSTVTYYNFECFVSSKNSLCFSELILEILKCGGSSSHVRKTWGLGQLKWELVPPRKRD